MKAALHEQFGAARADQLHSLGGGCFAMRGVDDFEFIDVELVLSGDGRDFRRRPDQNGIDDADRACELLVGSGARSE